MADQAAADVGLIGLAVMGQNLVLNMNEHGFVVCVYNRTVEKVDAFLANEAKGTRVVGARSISELCAAIKRPRKIILLVKAGSPVDDFIELLVPHLSAGDIVIDGGNSHYPDTVRRTRDLEARGFLFVGTGVSGGEEGARYGPSLMPGGSIAAWPHIKPIFQSIAAKTEEGAPCCDWVGGTGSGHYVKMVHNGIEYGDMQLICEAYHVMKSMLGMTAGEIGDTFGAWNKRELDSYLIEITRDIMRTRDPLDNEPLVDKIRDCAGQKGTGKWTAVAALDAGVPVTLIGEAVFARCLSSLKDERKIASRVLPAGPKTSIAVAQRDGVLADLEKALYAAKIISYAQGFLLLREAAKEHGWKLNYAAIAVMWKGGCIIRSRFLGDIQRAFEKEATLQCLLFDPFFCAALERTQEPWRRTVAKAVMGGVPVPAMSAALAFYDGYRTECLPANLLQAQRDYFGAHTFERVDAPGKWEHFNWTGRGGTTTSSTYNV